MDAFSALAEPTRRQIIELLAVRGQLAASDIYTQFPSTPPAISQHLKVLQEAKLVKVQRLAQKRLYEIDLEQLNQMSNWIKELNQVWAQRFKRLDQVLKVATERTL